MKPSTSKETLENLKLITLTNWIESRSQFQLLDLIEEYKLNIDLSKYPPTHFPWLMERVEQLKKDIYSALGLQ